MSNELIPYEAVKQMASCAVKSNLFGVQTEDQALSLMLLCQAENMHPMKAVQRYDIIQGRPSMKAAAMLADFIARGGKIDWHDRDDKCASATFYSVGCPKGLQVTWTIEDATRAGLAGKDNWRKSPRQMLSARVASEGVRAVDPGALQGLPASEEVMDYDIPDRSPIAAAVIAPTALPEKIETPPSPPPIDTHNENEVRGIMEDVEETTVQKKAGGTAQKYGLVVNGEKFGTFSKSLAEKAISLINSPVVLTWSANGKFKNAENVEPDQSK